MRGRRLLIVTAALLLSMPAVAWTASFSGGAFTGTTWQTYWFYQNAYGGGLYGSTSVSSFTGGNTGPCRACSGYAYIPAGVGGGPLMGERGAVVAQATVREDAVYDPQEQGAVNSIGCSLEAVTESIEMTPGLAEFTHDWGILICQGGLYYGCASSSTSDTWTTLAGANLQPADFTCINGAGMLDFSPTAPPMTLGFYHMTGVTSLDSAQASIDWSLAVDNWLVTVDSEAVEVTGLVEVCPQSELSATVSWTTDVASDSLVEYGIEGLYSYVVYDPALTTAHEITVPLYEPDAVYSFRVTSSDFLHQPAIGYGWYVNWSEMVGFQIPGDDEILSGEAVIKGMLNHGCIAATSATFQARSDTSGLVIPLGIDYDGTDECDNTFETVPTGDGWSVIWNTPMVPEGGYTLEVTFDTPIGVYTGSRHVWVDQTPPTPSLDQPPFSGRCYGAVAVAASGAADSNQCVFSKKKAEPIVEFPVTLGMVQTNYDMPNLPGSGNVMCHPTTQAAILWTSSDVSDLYTNGDPERNPKKDASVGQRNLALDLAAKKHTAPPRGTDSANSAGGSTAVLNYINSKKPGFKWKYDQKDGPIDIKKLKNFSKQPEGCVKGVGVCLRPANNPNAPGHAVALKKIDDNPKTDPKTKQKYYEVTIVDPMTGKEQTFKSSGAGTFKYPDDQGSTVCVGYAFRFVDTSGSGSVGKVPVGEWDVIAVDTDSSDGWSCIWDTSLEEPGIYDLMAACTDARGATGSDTTEAIVPAMCTMSDAKRYEDGTPVDLHDPVVTHIEDISWPWGEGGLIEEEDRSSGICFLGGYPFPARDDCLLEVRGSLGTIGLERVIYVDEIVPNTGVTKTIGPLAMPNRSVVGGDLGDPDGGKGQHGLPGAFGLNNVGLLVRTFGMCEGTAVGPDGTSYYVLNDGSGNLAMLSSDAAIPTGSYVRATGICSIQDWGPDRIAAIVRSRDAADVQFEALP